MLGLFFSCPSPDFGDSLSLNLELIDPSSLAGEWVLGIHVPALLSVLGLHMHATGAGICMTARDWEAGPHACTQALCWLSHLYPPTTQRLARNTFPIFISIYLFYFKNTLIYKSLVL